jgi:hypothetical protein
MTPLLATDHSCYNIQKIIDITGPNVLLFNSRSGLQGKPNLFSL